MMVSSLVMYGSHSQAFMSTSPVLPAVEAILESVGKAAPPMPTMPHSRTMAATSLALMLSQLAWPVMGAGLSLPSFFIMTHCTRSPPGISRSSMAVTVPETVACTGEQRPSPSPIFWPMSTASPTATSGAQAAPMCWRRGIQTVSGAGTGTGAPPRDISLCPSGWIPPPNSCFMFSPLKEIRKKLNYICSYHSATRSSKPGLICVVPSGSTQKATAPGNSSSSSRPDSMSMVKSAVESASAAPESL